MNAGRSGAIQLEELPHLPLGHLPTPIQPLTRLGQELGIELWVKRDDLTGLAFGGNKTRKLSYLIADAQKHGADTVITVGAVQSNHCRQTAAAAAWAGMDCILVLGGEPPEPASGNVLLDQLLGAEIVWTPAESKLDRVQAVFDQAVHDGRRPYLVPYGGSNPLGVCAYAAAMKEFMEQDQSVDRIVHASSSGGTQSGLFLGASVYDFEGRITGISVEPEADALRKTIESLVQATVEFLGIDVPVPSNRIEVKDDYLGAGYAVVGDLERGAVRRFAREEGLLLDPVYTGRAAGGLLDMVDRGEIEAGERVLFWHTGGTPALFAYADLVR
jgi:D-cysteine desulfhydrase family pyridoxal phosphate-dependent enzyme